MFLNTLYLIIAVVGLYFIFIRKRPRYPPGPTPLPLVGNLLSLGTEAHLKILALVQEYGPILSFHMASERAILLHGSQYIKEALNNPVFNGRPKQEAAENFFTGGPLGIALSNGELWAEQRRFALRHLRDFGFGKTSMEGLIMSEVRELVDWIKQKKGEPVTLHRRFTLAIINALWTIIAGERYDHDDAKLTNILQQFEATQALMLNYGAKSLLIMFFPKIAQMFPKFSGWKYLVEAVAPRRDLVRKAIEEHQRTVQYDGHPRDFIDTYLQNIKKTDDPNSSFYGEAAIQSLQAVLDDFFFAGTDTSSTTLGWAILYLLHHSEVQDKLHAEIDSVIGKTRLPSLTDRSSLPYTEAFFMEVTRMSSILSAGVPHAATEDVEFHGYHIPKGTMVMASLYSTHHDPKIWGDPENFRPERFLSADGSKVQKHESLLPFSTGKRACLGETFAKNQVFLFVTTLVQQFDILPEPGKPKPTLAVKQGTTLQSHQYFLIMKERL